MSPMKRAIYRNIAIEKGGFVDQYIQKVYETNDCKSREEAIQIIIEQVDPDWEFLDAV